MQYPSPPIATPVPASQVPSARVIPGTELQLVDDEVVIRSWPVTRPHTMGQAEGNLHLTDARIVFTGRMRSLFGRANYVQEVHLQDVSGINAVVQRGPGVFGAAFLVAWSLITFFSFLAMLAATAAGAGGAGFIWFLLSCGVLALGIWYALNVGTVGFVVRTRSVGTAAMGFVVSSPSASGYLSILRGFVAPVGAILARLGVISPLELLWTGPTPEVEQVMAELGAAILRVQAQGRLAVQG